MLNFSDPELNLSLGLHDIIVMHHEWLLPFCLDGLLNYSGF
uniref:Uncharacterized protein n=1 Tax=Manihot esculenta TaxID=3983 RepID=A0A2C9V5V1_MANES